MPAAEAAEIVAVGRSVVGVGDDVVEIRPARPVPAAGVAASLVASPSKPLLRRARRIPVDPRRPLQHGTAAAAPGVRRTPSAYRLLELSAGEGRPQGATGAEQIEVQRAARGRLKAAEADGVECGEQCPQVSCRDRLPLHLGDARRAAAAP